MVNTTKIKTYVDDFHQDMESDTVFGFWVYIMTDCLLFSTLFAVYATMPVMPNEFGEMPADIFDLKLVFGETMLLLTSSFTFGLTMLAIHKDQLKKVVYWLVTTMALGLSFLSIELWEFYHLTNNGSPITLNGYWGSFYALVATHGLHVTAGIIWILVMFVNFKRDGLTTTNKTRLSCLSLFWHFLDIIWIAVFTIVYLLGVL